MRTRTIWLIAGLFVLAILAIASTSVGIALLRHPAVAIAPIQQAIPVYGVTHVFMRNNVYQPSNIEVVVGTAVSWTNQDNVVHSVVLPHANTSNNDIRESGHLFRGSRLTTPSYQWEHLNITVQSIHT